MNNNAFGIDKQVFFNYLKNTNFSSDEMTYLIRLYKMYSLTEKIVESKGENALRYYEKKIYTINGKIMSDIKRIQLEIYSINKTLDSKICSGTLDDKTIDFIKEVIEELNQLLLSKDDLDKALIDYMKKKISVIQAKLGLNNTFFNATREAFFDEYRKIDLYNLEKNNYNVLLDDNIYNDNIKRK